MDDDLDANEEVNFCFHFFFFILFELREVEEDFCFSRTFSFGTNEQTLITKTNETVDHQ